MTRSWDDVVTASRNWRGISLAFGLCVILVWALISRPSDELVRKERVMGVVIEVRASEVGNFVKFKLPSGKHTSLLVNQSLKIGDQRPLLIEGYESSKQYVSYDNMDWNLNY